MGRSFPREVGKILYRRRVSSQTAATDSPLSRGSHCEARRSDERTPVLLEAMISRMTPRASEVIAEVQIYSAPCHLQALRKPSFSACATVLA